LISGRIRYFPERFPYPRLNPGYLSSQYFHILIPRKYLLFIIFFSYFLFPLILHHKFLYFHPKLFHLITSTSPPSTLFHHSPPHKSSTSPSPWQVPIGQGEHLTPHMASSYWPSDTSPSTLQLSPSQLFNCISFTNSKTYKYHSFSFHFSFSLLFTKEKTFTKSLLLLHFKLPTPKASPRSSSPSQATTLIGIVSSFVDCIAVDHFRPRSLQASLSRST